MTSEAMRTPRRRTVGSKGATSTMPTSSATEGTPLVEGDLEQGLPSFQDEPEDVEEPTDQLKPIKEGSIRELLVGIFAGITFLSSAFAMLINGGLFVFISGLFGIGFAPFAAFQQQKITQTIALKETNAFFENQLDRLRVNNENLSKQVSDMKGSIDHLKDMEKTLDTVQNIQGNCLQELEGQLKKQREIAAMTHSSVENEIISNLFEIAINCDDGDMHLSDEEIKHLITRIEAINGVTVKKLAVLNLIESHGRDLMALMEVTKNLLRHDIPEEDKLFQYS